MLLKSLALITLYCTRGYAMRLQEADLNVPEASSFSQNYQEQKNPQADLFQQPDSLSPFLYSFMIVGPRSSKQNIGQKETKITEKNVLNLENSYKLYRPDYDENPQFVEMLPPSLAQDEPNYYGLVKRKSKKYSATEDKQKKYLKMKEAKNNGSIDRRDRQESDYAKANDEQPQPSNNERVELYTNPKTDRDTKRQGQDSQSGEEATKEDSESLETSAPSSRLDFQIHGHKGPATYKFGFDTGEGKNRQFKVEEKDENGNVIGQYGYHDDKGKFRIIKYTSMKNDGFKIL